MLLVCTHWPVDRLIDKHFLDSLNYIRLEIPGVRIRKLSREDCLAEKQWKKADLYNASFYNKIFFWTLLLMWWKSWFRSWGKWIELLWTQGEILFNKAHSRTSVFLVPRLSFFEFLQILTTIQPIIFTLSCSDWIFSIFLSLQSISGRICVYFTLQISHLSHLPSQWKIRVQIKFWEDTKHKSGVLIK